MVVVCILAILTMKYISIDNTKKTHWKDKIFFFKAFAILIIRFQMLNKSLARDGSV